MDVSPATVIAMRTTLDVERRVASDCRGEDRKMPRVVGALNGSTCPLQNGYFIIAVYKTRLQMYLTNQRDSKYSLSIVQLMQNNQKGRVAFYNW